MTQDDIDFPSLESQADALVKALSHPQTLSPLYQSLIESLEPQTIVILYADLQKLKGKELTGWNRSLLGLIEDTFAIGAIVLGVNTNLESLIKLDDDDLLYQYRNMSFISDVASYDQRMISTPDAKLVNSILDLLKLDSDQRRMFELNLSRLSKMINELLLSRKRLEEQQRKVVDAARDLNNHENRITSWAPNSES